MTTAFMQPAAQLAEQGRYGEAITILSLAADKTDPRILNYLGYSHRKAGRVTVGLGYYQEALRHDPNYTLVREYMGEAYLQQGNVEAAKEQLTEIEKRCGKGCEEYAELAEQIDAYSRVEAPPGRCMSGMTCHPALVLVEHGPHIRKHRRTAPILVA